MRKAVAVDSSSPPDGFTRLLATPDPRAQRACCRFSAYLGPTPTMDRMARVRLPLLLSALLALLTTALGLKLLVDYYRVPYSVRRFDDVSLAWVLPTIALGLALLIMAVVGWRRDSAVMALVSCVIWATLTFVLAYACLAFVVIAIAFTSLGVRAAARLTTQLR